MAEKFVYKKYIDKTLDFLKELDELGLDKNDYVIMGSGPLSIRGLVNPEDLDILIKKDKWIFGEEEPIRKNDLELSWSFPGIENPNEVIRNFDVFYGYHFAKLEYVLKSKQVLNREKDQEHIEVIENILFEKNSINRKYIEDRLDELGVASWIISRYDEPHRFYHNLNHIIKMLKGLFELGKLNNDTLFLAIIFHDIVYDPIRKDNEEKSAELFNYIYDGDPVIKREVTKMILDTITHKPSSELSEILIKLDLSHFEGTCEEMIKDHENVAKEYLPYYTPKQFQEGNLKVLEHFKKMGYDLDCLINYVKKRY